MPATSSTPNVSAVASPTFAEAASSSWRRRWWPCMVLIAGVALELGRRCVGQHAECAVDAVGDAAGWGRARGPSPPAAAPTAAPCGLPTSGISLPIEYRIDARVVAVLADHRLDVALPPLGKCRAESKSVLPSVHMSNASSMTSTPSRSQASSMARLIGLWDAADGVEPGRLEQLDAALLGPVDRRRAERPVVVVDAGAAQLDRLTVDPQAALGVERTASGCRT